MKKRQTQTPIIFFKTSFFVLTVFVFSFSALSYSASKVVEDIDYIYLHIGLEVDHPLPKKLKKEQLKFEGNYKKYTSFVYRKASNDIRFKPKRAGSAVIIIKNKKDEILGRLSIDVQKDNLHKVAAELRDLLIAVDGIEIKIINKKVIIDGQVLLPREMDRIKAVKSKYESHLIESLVTYSPEAQKKVATIVQDEIGYPEVTVRYAYNRFLLEGCVGSKAEKQRAQSIASLYAQFEVSSTGKEGRSKVDLIKNELSFPCESEKKEAEKEKKDSEIKKLIQIVVHFVEMEKDFNKAFLFRWNPSIGDGSNQTQLTVSAGAGQILGLTSLLQATITNLFPKLNWAKSFSFARVLHNSSVLVEEGEEGIISIGTHIQRPTVVNDQAVNTDVVSSKVSTSVTPQIIGDRKNLIKMRVHIQVASPSANEGVTNRKIATSIHVRDSESAVLGGVISSFLSRKYNPQPGNRGIINFQSAKTYGATKSQFVVFITPLIKSTSSSGVDRIKRKFNLEE